MMLGMVWVATTVGTGSRVATSHGNNNNNIVVLLVLLLFLMARNAQSPHTTIKMSGVLRFFGSFGLHSMRRLVVLDFFGLAPCRCDSRGCRGLAEFVRLDFPKVPKLANATNATLTLS